jgi:uncharacterized membrane protein
VTARVANAALVALALLGLLWELWLAPLRPGGSWLALKVVPLALLLPGALSGRRRTLQQLALLLPFYLAEGIVRAISESGRHAVVAAFAAIVAAIALAAVLAWLRESRAPR